MSNEKNFSARFQQLTDTEDNWENARVDGKLFIPKKGEIVVYQEEIEENGTTKTKSQIKIGDGKTPVSDLEFIGGGETKPESFFLSSEENEPINYANDPVDYPLVVKTTYNDSQIIDKICVGWVGGKNYYDKKAYPLTAGYYVITSSGKITSSQNYYCTRDFIPVMHLKGKKIILSGAPTSGSNPGLCFYTQPNESGYIKEGATNRNKTTVPASANFMRFSIRSNYITNLDTATVQLEIGEEETDYEEYIGNNISYSIERACKEYNWETGALTDKDDNKWYLPNCQLKKFDTPHECCFYSYLGATTISSRNEFFNNFNENYFDGCERGKQLFLDTIVRQDRTDYERAFVLWNCEYIRPSIPVVPGLGSRVAYIFYGNALLKKIEKRYFDFSKIEPSTTANTNGWYTLFKGCWTLEEIEDIGMAAGGYYQTFYNCYALKKLHILRVTPDCQFNGTFNSCTSLIEIGAIEGKIGQDGLNLSWSPLDQGTLLRVVNALDTVTSQKTITLRQSAVDNAFKTDDEKAAWNDAKGQAEGRGWTISLMDS